MTGVAPAFQHDASLVVYVEFGLAVLAGLLFTLHVVHHAPMHPALL